MKKKLLFLITTLGNGGAERVLVDLVNNLNTEKFDITVQTIIDSGERISELHSNVHYKYIFKKSNSFAFRILFFLMRKVFSPRWMYRLFIKSDYDVEISFLEGLPTKIISGSTNKISKKFAWVHIDLMKYFGSRSDYISYDQIKEAYQKYDKIVGVSSDVVNSFKERFLWKKGNLIVIYNPNDDEGIIKKSKEIIEIPPTDNKLRLISCGRLSPQKGFDRLLRVHKRLIDEGLIHDLWIVGEGPERGKLEEYINNNSLQNTTTLWGFHSNPYPFLLNSDLFVCSSIAEGYSMVVTEACLLGVPVITTDVCGLREPVECPRYNVICDNNEADLYEALKHVIENPLLVEQYKKDQQMKSAFFSKEKQISCFEKLFLND